MSAPSMLKPCPFCGTVGTAAMQVSDADFDGLYLVWCDGCMAEGPIVDGPAGAIAAWETRFVETDAVALAKEVIRVLYEKSGPENEHLSDDEANLWHQARAFISKVHGMDGKALPQEASAERSGASKESPDQGL